MKGADTFPTHVKDGIKYKAGKALPFGATLIDNDVVNFSIYSKYATSCTLVLFKFGESEPYFEITIPDEFKIGSVYSIMVFELDWENTEYGYRFDGPYDLQNGFCFDRTRIVLDPYAKLVSGREKWHTRQYPKDSFQFRGRIIREDYDWDGDVRPDIPMKDLVIYEMHVRGFTNDKSSGVKGKGTFSGVVEKIPYLKELGVNCIEFMPLFEFEDFFPDLDDEPVNYWGYSTCNYFSPKAAYAKLGHKGFAADEMKNMIKKLHQNGIEVLLDVVFNHTAEYGDGGEYISFRGVDNKTFYLMDNGHYVNYSACGNTVNCNNPIVRSFIIDALRYWVSDYHVDGFRIDEAPIFARGEDGRPMVSPPLVDSLKNDPILSKAKLISEGWDPEGLSTIGKFPEGWADWNPRMRDTVKRFVKGVAESGPELISSIEGSPDMFSNGSPESSVNYITSHDGFTLYDATAYNNAHNESNTYTSPMDSEFDNCSWNCGIEGETDDKEIEGLRKRQMKNAMTLLMLSRGVPMFWAGDEFANTQYGNNNAFSQDTIISWLDWNRLKKYKDVFEYTKKLIAFRKAHPVIRKGDYFTGHNSMDYPELSWHSEKPWMFNRHTPFLTFGFMYSEPDREFGTGKDTFIYCAVNSHWEEHTFELPIIPEGMNWKVEMYSADEYFAQSGDIVDRGVTLAPRSSMILTGERSGE